MQSIFRIQSLEELDASNNTIALLPTSMSSAVCLRVLKLDNNQLVELPAEMCGCTALTELHIGFNAIAVRIAPRARRELDCPITPACV